MRIEMAKSKKTKLEIPEEEPIIVFSEGELKEVIGITEAEKLQKSGWRLIDCHLTPEGKKYKFRKV